MEIVTFFWNALKELQNGANFGLRKPIMIMKGMFERAGIDLVAIASMQRQDQGLNGKSRWQTSSEDEVQGLPFLPESNMDYLPDEQYQDLFQSMSVDNIDWPEFLDDVEMATIVDPLYGLFRSDDEHEGTGTKFSNLDNDPAAFLGLA